MEYHILHTCIRVKDLDRSLKFYEEALGFKETRRIDLDEGKSKLVFLTDEKGTHEIELTYDQEREEPYEIGDGFNHIGVKTKNLEGSRERHKEMGYEVTDFMGFSEGKPKYYFVIDPDGYRIEVLRAD